MICKTLGIALIAVLSMTATAVSAAQAEVSGKATTEAGTERVDATQTAPGTLTRRW